jgi:hypothetical protein
MPVSYSTTVRNNRLAAVITAAGSAAWLQVWGGAVPANPTTAPAGTLLASLAMANPIAPAPSGGVMTMSAIANDASANGTGTPTFARIATSETGTTTGIAQMTAGVGSGDLNFDASIVTGGTVSVTSLTITDASS